MTKSERILKNYRKMNPEAVAINVNRDTWFYDIVDENGKILYSGDLTKYTRGVGGMKSAK